MIKLVSITKPQIEELEKAEDLIVYCARVFSTNNQLNLETTSKLISSLIKHKHWHPFEMVDVCFEIVTRCSIAAQILRHRSFSFPEFSMRYSKATKIQDIELRKQADKNMQSSTDVFNPFLDEYVGTIAEDEINFYKDHSISLYNDLIKKGVAKEVARDVLPLATETTLYMKGSLKSWIHYLQVRTDEATQKEHRTIALEIERLLRVEFPNVFEALKDIS